MSKNLIIGIAAGVAAVVVIAAIVKKTSLLDALMEKIFDLGDAVEDRLSDYGELIPKGEDKNISTNLHNN